MMRRAYQSDLSDAEWAYLKPHLPSPKPGGRLRVHTVGETLDAIFYVVRGGCAWRLLPHDFRHGRPSTTTTSGYDASTAVGAAARGFTLEGAGTTREGPATERRNRRFAVGEDYLDGR